MAFQCRKQEVGHRIGTYQIRRMSYASVFQNGHIKINIEPPRLYRRVIYLSQAAMPDRIKLS